jgi:hypothetical protein
MTWLAHASSDVEVDGETLQELSLPCVDPPIGKQKIGDDGERRRPQPSRDRPGGRLHHRRGFLLFKQPLHPIDETADGLA